MVRTRWGHGCLRALNPREATPSGPKTIASASTPSQRRPLAVHCERDAERLLVRPLARDPLRGQRPAASMPRASVRSADMLLIKASLWARVGVAAHEDATSRVVAPLGPEVRRFRSHDGRRETGTKQPWTWRCGSSKIGDCQ